MVHRDSTILVGSAWAKVRELPEELEEHGLVGGTWCSDAQPRGQLRCLSSTLFLEGLTGLLHRSTTLFGTIVMLERDCCACVSFVSLTSCPRFKKKTLPTIPRNCCALDPL